MIKPEVWKYLARVYPEIALKPSIDILSVLDVLAERGWEVTVNHFLESREHGPVKRYKYTIEGQITSIQGSFGSYTEAYENALIEIGKTEYCLRQNSTAKD